MKNTISPVATFDQSLDSLIKTIRIPPRPGLLIDIQRELAQVEPSPMKLAKIIANDVSLSASLLKLTNSSFFGLRTKANSVEQAVSMIGMEQSSLLMMGLIARQVVGAKDASMSKFWDFSSKRGRAMTYLAKRIPVCSGNVAHTFGLFCDTGIPLLSERFPDYASTITKANKEFEYTFTAIEDQRHNTNHAAIGALLTRSWGLPEEISMAILLHHDYKELNNSAISDLARGLIALSLLAEYAIHQYHGKILFSEWEKGGNLACQFLGISADQAADRLDELHELFSQEQ
jgi:HD-like signal output (HDOD) protein